MAAEQLITRHLDLWTAAIKRRSTAGRGSSSKVELYGIKKLRELILELAVRGLLVPQDPRDEPASELLKRISAEKAKLVKEGKIKSDKSQPPISDRDLQIALPNGWCLARLGSFVSIVRGITFPASEKNSEPGPGLVACLRTANVQAKIDWEDLLYIDSSFIRRHDQYLQVGDIVMSMANSRELVGKVSYAGSIPVARATFGGFLGVIRPYRLSASYLMCVLRAPKARASLIDSASQTTNIANISLEKLNPLVVALPPLAEQHRIVAKVDELMALCDQLEQQTDASLSAHQTLVETLLNALTSAADHTQFASAWQRIAEHFDTLFSTEESIDQLKQTILQLAVMGKLVPQDPNDEPASELLKKIAVEKAKLVKEGKIKKDKLLPPIAENEKPYELPEGWAWVRSYQVAESRLGKMLDRAKNSGAAYPYLRNTNVQWQRVDLDDIKEINLEPHELDEYRLRDGDLLICEGGEPGRCAIWRAQKSEMYFQKALHRVRTLGGVLPEYIAICLRVDAQCGRLDQFFTGATIKHFAGQELNRYFFALPPVTEQRRIIAKVDELMALCDQLKSRLNTADQLRLKLAEAVTDAALNPPSAEIIPFPDAAARDARRHAIGCHVVARLKDQRKFGRTMLMKLMYLADTHVGADLGLEPKRAARGPLDSWIYDFEMQAKAAGWFEHEEMQGDKILYKPQAGLTAQAAKVQELLDAAQVAELDRVLTLFATLSTEDAEIIATLFAAWNDFLIDGHTPDDAEVIREVRENWTPEKQRFKPEQLQTWLDWIRKNKLVPRGRGPRTVQQTKLFY